MVHMPPIRPRPLILLQGSRRRALMLALVRRFLHSFNSFFLGNKNLTEIEMSSRVLPSFLQSIMLFLLDMFLSDQSRPCLDSIHGGNWRWSYDRKLLLLGNARDCTCSEVSSCKSFLMVLPRCSDLTTDTWDLNFRAEGLFYSRPVSVGGIYYFLCCLQPWIFHCSFPSVIYLILCRDFLN